MHAESIHHYLYLTTRMAQYIEGVFLILYIPSLISNLPSNHIKYNLYKNQDFLFF